MALTTDPHTYLLDYLLDEEPAGEEHGANSNRVDSGYMYGETAPPDSWRLVFRFHGLSNIEGLLPAETETSLRRILAKFYCGGEMRAYRNYPVDMTLYDVDTNIDGYSDMVPYRGDESENYPWGDETLTRFDFTLEGVEVA